METQKHREQSTKVKVIVRVRPSLIPEDRPWVQVIDAKTLQTVNHRNTEEALQYEFSSVYDDKSTQKAVYDENVKPIISQVINGKNASVFAYGPTGAGKTHTILGKADVPGVIPRCVKDIFESIDEQKANDKDGNWVFNVAFSYLEIYNEKVLDLLKQKEKDLPIREDGHRNIFVVGLEEQKIASVTEFNESFGPASKKRTTASTKLNERSSRSHSVLMLKVQCLQKVPPYCRRSGKMYIIDLAGSEDNRRTGNKGVRLKESGAINSSLLALGQVVEALNKGQSCVPYRGSKLTRLLQDSLGGNAITCMIVNLAPEEQHYFDTYTTLHFARKTKKIVNTVKINESFEKPAPKPAESKPSKRPIAANKTEEEPPEKKPAFETASANPGLAPFLSPLIRSHETMRSKLQQEMDERLEKLEQKLLKQFSEKARESEQEHKESDTDIGTTLRRSPRVSGREVLTDLKQFKDQLTKMKSDTNKITKRGEKKTYADGSSKENVRDLVEVSCSPLFLNRAIIRKKKSFKSVATKLQIDESIESTDESNSESPHPITLNAELQKEHNDKILNVLNGGSMKDIQGLQTLGPKRAQLIFNWRSLHGAFESFDDLNEVEGLNHRFVSTFLRRNLVHL